MDGPIGPRDLNSTLTVAAARIGWQSSPNQRGTMDIIWSCVSTLFLCLWTMLHLNVPAADDKFTAVFLRKLRWLVLGVLAPELPMLFACGQYASASRSVRDMRDLGFDEHRWTLCHAFYADSGGYVLHPLDSQPFPITAKQLHYLVRHGYVALPNVTRDELWDKSKADGVTKFLAFLQSGWLVLQLIGRAAQHLPVTPFELSTLAVTCSALVTLAFWWRKPLDVRTPPVLAAPHSTVSDILREAGDAAKEPFRDTPLDFAEGRCYMSSKWSRHVLRWICRAGLQTRPLARIPDDRDPQASLGLHTLLGLGTAAFATIHLLGWKFDFGSPWERYLWRASCVSIWVLLCLYGFTEVVLCYRDNYAIPGLESGGAYKMRWPHCLMFFIPATLYCLARLGLLVVSISTLSSLPAGAYENVQWTGLLPHF